MSSSSRSLHGLALIVCIGVAIALSAAPGTVPASTPQQQTAPAPAPLPLTLPNQDGALKFGVMGDFGTGSRQQQQLADQMARVHSQFPFELMITVGDNMYGGQRPGDFVKKFETPYKALLGAGVKFYASLGNHDNRQQAAYSLFNMGGRTYYTFKAPKQDVRFFALESSYLDPAQLQWLERELENSREDWKIPYFHHPLYSSGDRHGSDLSKRKVLEPLFLKYGVTVVFAGHDHVYERVVPQQGITHFVVGSSGQLRKGNLDRSTGFTAVANATEHVFLAAEIAGDELHFNAVSRTGKVIDAGVIARRKLP
jgi:3',5'-cyclic AMP phosphodiesterase CpdA